MCDRRVTRADPEHCATRADEPARFDRWPTRTSLAVFCSVQIAEGIGIGPDGGIASCVTHRSKPVETFRLVQSGLPTRGVTATPSSRLASGANGSACHPINKPKMCEPELSQRPTTTAHRAGRVRGETRPAKPPPHPGQPAIESKRNSAKVAWVGSFHGNIATPRARAISSSLMRATKSAGNGYAKTLRPPKFDRTAQADPKASGLPAERSTGSAPEPAFLIKAGA